MSKLRLMDKPDPDEFNIPASDTKGHNVRLWLRCIPMMGRMIEQIIQSGKFPYRTQGDLLRHAVHRHVNWLNQQEQVTSVAGQVDAILAVMKDEEMNNDFNLVFSKLDDRISQHISAGENPEAVRLILVIQNHINQMPDGYWKKRYRAQMADKYGRLVSGAGRANMATMEDED